nr:dehydrogenase [Shinella kummerowiae]
MPTVAATQENGNVRAESHEPRNEVDEALAWHGGNVRAAVATLLADCAYLRWQLQLADRAISSGFTRGWRPQAERD